MTRKQKLLCIKLFRGWYIVKTINRSGHVVYRVYDEKCCVQQVITEITKRAISRRTYIRIWKKDSWGRITFNLSAIRQLHGKHTLKRMYKMKDYDDEIKTFLTGSKRTKKNQTKADDKSLLLF